MGKGNQGIPPSIVQVIEEVDRVAALLRAWAGRGRIVKALAAAGETKPSTGTIRTLCAETPELYQRVEEALARVAAPSPYPKAQNQYEREWVQGVTQQLGELRSELKSCAHWQPFDSQGVPEAPPSQVNQNIERLGWLAIRVRLAWDPAYGSGKAWLSNAGADPDTLLHVCGYILDAMSHQPVWAPLREGPPHVEWDRWIETLVVAAKKRGLQQAGDALDRYGRSGSSDDVSAAVDALCSLESTLKAEICLRLEAHRDEGEKTAPGDVPDEEGYVRNPIDPKAYCPASKIVAEHWKSPPLRNVSNRYKQLNKILDGHARIRRWRPDSGRYKLLVHLGDWRAHLAEKDEARQQEAALIAKRQHWWCSQCRRVVLDIPSVAECPYCGSDDVEIVHTRPPK